VQGDLRSPEEVVANIQAWLKDARRPLDGLIHCAVSYGADGRHGFLQTRDGEWDEVMAVNVRSPFVLTLRLLPLLLQRPRAFIVSLTSDTATRPAPQRIAYGCSKAACHSLFSGLAAELADSAVSVIQMMPRRQVITRGIRGRRPPDFQFEGYDRPQIFDEPFTTILASRGAGMNGQCLIVG
jgi:NAD(P)-dependent dehydrogenase (short-subunit alcohol dehydrogenase family)